MIEAACRHDGQEVRAIEREEVDAGGSGAMVAHVGAQIELGKLRVPGIVGMPRTLMRSIQKGTTPIQAEPSNVSRCRPSGSSPAIWAGMRPPMGKEQVVPALGHCPAPGGNGRGRCDVRTLISRMARCSWLLDAPPWIGMHRLRAPNEAFQFDRCRAEPSSGFFKKKHESAGSCSSRTASCRILFARTSHVQ